MNIVTVQFKISKVNVIGSVETAAVRFERDDGRLILWQGFATLELAEAFAYGAATAFRVTGTDVKEESRTI